MLKQKVSAHIFPCYKDFNVIILTESSEFPDELNKKTTAATAASISDDDDCDDVVGVHGGHAGEELLPHSLTFKPLYVMSTWKDRITKDPRVSVEILLETGIGERVRQPMYAQAGNRNCGELWWLPRLEVEPRQGFI